MNRAVSVVIVTHQSEAVIERCLAPLAQAQHRVVVIDNASTDATVARARRTLPDARIVENRTNFGYGRACNTELRTMATPFALLLNPDAVIAPAQIDALVDRFEGRIVRTALVAPLLTRPDGSIEPNVRSNYFTPDEGGADASDAELIRLPDRPVDFVAFAVCVLNVALVREIGFFDENIFLYGEDDDLCRRLILAGHSVIVAPSVPVPHIGDASSRVTPRIIYRKSWHRSWSSLYLCQKSLGRRRARLRAAALCWSSTRELIVSVVRLKPRAALQNLATLAGRIAFAAGRKAF